MPILYSVPSHYCCICTLPFLCMLTQKDLLQCAGADNLLDWSLRLLPHVPHFMGGGRRSKRQAWRTPFAAPPHTCGAASRCARSQIQSLPYFMQNTSGSVWICASGCATSLVALLPPASRHRKSIPAASRLSCPSTYSTPCLPHMPTPYSVLQPPTWILSLCFHPACMGCAHMPHCMCQHASFHGTLSFTQLFRQLSGSCIPCDIMYLPSGMNCDNMNKMV